MKKFLPKYSVTAIGLIMANFIFINTTLAQTTIASGNTTNASAITAGNTITIDAGGTLNMDVARSFASITTKNSGTSTISGSNLLTITGNIIIASANTLSLNPSCNASALSTSNLNNSTAGISGAGTLTITNDITVNKKSGNNTGTFDIAAGTTVICGSVLVGNGNNGSFDMTVSGTLKLSGSFDLDNLTCNSTSTVEYNGTAQTVFDTNYHNLALSGSGTKTLQPATTAISGDFTLGGTAVTTAVTALTVTGNVLLGNGTSFTAGNFTHNVAGNWTNNGTTFTPGTGTISLNGNTQTIGGTAATTFYNLSTVGSGTKNLGANTIVNNTLNLGTPSPISIGSNTLTLKGPVTGSGKLSGSATSSLVIAGAAGTLNFDQTSAATRSLNNISFNAGTSATLGSALDVYGTISLTTATFHLAGQNLTLKSNATNTAMIANLTGSTFDGATNVTVERYIPLPNAGTGRRYRLLTPTVSTATSIKANWQEGQMNTSIGTNINNIPGYGTQITGSGANTNGFDKTQTNQSSLYLTTNSVTPGYTAVTSTLTNTLNAKTGYFLFIRGDRSANMTLANTTGMPTSATTLRATGTLLTGTQTSFSAAFTGGAGVLNMVTNPYPSAIDWSAVYSDAGTTNIASSYTLWDAEIGTRGGFVTVSNTGVKSNTSSAATINIQPGQAFFIQATSAAVPTLAIKESHKSSVNSNGIYRATPAAPASFSTVLYFTDGTGFRQVADGVTAVFAKNFSAAIDDNDAYDINNWDENIAITRNGKHLAIEARPAISSKDTLPLFMNNMKQMNYEFQFEGANFNSPGLNAFLVDHFTGTRTLLSVSGVTVVPFTVSEVPASAASDRFTIIFGLKGDVITPRLSPQIKAITKTDSTKGNTEPAANATSVVSTTATTAVTAAPVSTNVAGTISVFPNPAPGGIVYVQFAGMVAGNYTARLINNMGQAVLSRQLVNKGDKTTQSILLGDNIARGYYLLEISSATGEKSTRKIVVE